MNIKKILILALFLSCLELSVFAMDFNIETLDAKNITYCSATLWGNVSIVDTDISSYGIEIWSENTSPIRNQAGSENVTGRFSLNFYLVDDTEYSYRTYVTDNLDNIHYGAIKSFKTLKKSIETPPVINLNIKVENPDTINFAETPNKFFLNNLIVNNPDHLKLIAGNDFAGVDGIIGVGNEKIFINQYFINNYYSDPVLRSLLTVFDAVVYNRSEFVWDAATSIVPDFVYGGIYRITPDALKSTLNSLYGDMGIKRFNSAINSTLSNDYISSDKRTFGYDKTNYNLINAFSSSSKTADKMVKDFNDGHEKLIDGIEDYQAYYFKTIMPQYSNAQNNLLGINKYLLENAGSMSAAEIADSLKYAGEYSKEISAYEKLDFAYEAATKWKTEIETNYYAENVVAALEKIGKPLNLAVSSIGTLKTLNQVQNNKNQLYDIFDRLANSTDNQKLKITLNDYLFKTENAFGSFLADSAANISSVYLKSSIKKNVNESIEKSARKLVNAENKLYAGWAVDSAVAKANYALIATDVGGMFSEKISGTKTYLEKAIEAKYLWNIENESKRLLQKDLLKYEQNPTEENASDVLSDLFWIKSLKLREITITKELYNSNGDSWLSLTDKRLGEISAGIDSMFVSQRDALINASLTETQYTNEILELAKGETYTLFGYNSDVGGSGAITTNSDTITIKNAEARLAGGVNIMNGATLNIAAPGTTVYIPIITMESGANLTITGGNVIIGEFIQNGGTIVVTGDSVVDIKGDVTFKNKMSIGKAVLNIMGNVTSNGDININEGKINISGNLTQISEKRAINVGNGALKIDGDYSLYEGTFNAGSGRTEIGGKCTMTSSPGSWRYSYFKMQNDDGYVLVNGEFDMNIRNSNSGNITAGTLELKGDFKQKSGYDSMYGAHENFPAEGTHKVILSGDGSQRISFDSKSSSYFNILEPQNQNLAFDTAVQIKKLHDNMTFKNLNLYGADFKDITTFNVTGDLTLSGISNLNTATVNVGGNLALSSAQSHTLNINEGKLSVGGDASIYHILNINNGVIEINGNLTQNSKDGIINVGNGTLRIDGDYSLYEGTFNAGSGRTEIGGKCMMTSSPGSWRYSYFKMQNDDGYVLVNGEFDMNIRNSNSGNITAGTLELKGDFKQKSGYDAMYGAHENFPAEGTHKVILSGDESQRISFDSGSSSYFNILVNKNLKSVFKKSTYKYIFTEIPYTLKFETGTDSGAINRFFGQDEEASVKTQIRQLGELKKEGFIFAGWYTDEKLINEWTGDIISSNLTLYARWIEPIVIDSISSETSTISISITLSEQIYLKDGIVLIAVYDGESLVTVHEKKTDEIVIDTFNNIDPDKSYGIKVFCWSDFETISPLCDAYYIERLNTSEDI